MLDSFLPPSKVKKFINDSSDCRAHSPFSSLPSHRLHIPTNTRIFQPDDMASAIIQRPSLLSHLSEEVLVLILEYLDFKSLIILSKTCRLFHRLCLSDLIWRHRCKVRTRYSQILLCTKLLPENFIFQAKLSFINGDIATSFFHFIYHSTKS